MGVAGKRGEDADVEDEDENVGVGEVCPPDDPGGEPEPDPDLCSPVGKSGRRGLEGSDIGRESYGGLWARAS